jgi:tetratricopeptide (TPR) repeat protein
MTQLTIQQAFDLAMRHHQAGQLTEAEQLCRQIVSQRPDHAGALHYLGVLALQNGRDSEAVDLIQRAIALASNNPEAYAHLGIALEHLGKLDEAEGAYRQAIALRADYLEAYIHLVTILRSKGQLDEAQAACSRAIQIDSNCAEAYGNLGNLLKDRGKFNDAIIAYRRAIELKPHLADSHTNLGFALAEIGQVDEATAALSRSIAIKPQNPEAYLGLGNVLSDEARWDEAIAAYQKSIAFSPDFAQAHNNLAFALLASGEFKHGWQELEWRWKCADNYQLPQRNLVQPTWDGSPLAGRTILIQTEHGFGDSIQFIRYVPLVAGHDGKIIIECQPELQRLFQTVHPSAQVIARGDPLPRFDVHCGLLSLPRIFGTTLGNIPNAVPYLYADDQKAAKWRARLADDPSAFNVGLVWTGNPANRLNRNRAVDFSMLAGLGNVAGVRFVSLQKGAATVNAKNPPPGFEIVDWTDELKDFSDTAALITNLDLIISVDTAVAHLSAAMNKPVWLLIPFMPEWRWMLVREDSPWYPTMRLFRQETRGDWGAVVSRIAKELSSVLN